MLFAPAIVIPPAIVVHGLDDAHTALRLGHPVTLLSARGAAGYAGCGWWRALITQATAAYPATPAADILDCADAPGHAMEALRAGQRLLILEPTCPAFAAIAGAAATIGATVMAQRPDALDLAERGAIRQLAAWLQRS